MIASRICKAPPHRKFEILAKGLESVRANGDLRCKSSKCIQCRTILYVVIRKPCPKSNHTPCTFLFSHSLVSSLARYRSKSQSKTSPDSAPPGCQRYTNDRVRNKPPLLKANSTLLAHHSFTSQPQPRKSEVQKRTESQGRTHYRTQQMERPTSSRNRWLRFSVQPLWLTLPGEFLSCDAHLEGKYL